MSDAQLTRMGGLLKPREKRDLPSTMRDRIAAALECSRPRMWRNHEPNEAIMRWRYSNDVERAYYGEWCDGFLLCLDQMELEMIDHADRIPSALPSTEQRR